MTVEESDKNVSGPAPLREMFHLEHFSRFYKMYVPVSILIGVVCGLSMVAFHLLIVTTTHMLSGIPIYIAPLIGGILSGGFIYLGVREIEGSGISKAIELTHDPGELHTRTVLTKMVATSVSIGSGNPVGREGPAVLIGAAIGNYIGRKLGYRDASHLRTFLMMGSAACTAGIYGAPLGGALFATEAPYKRDARLGYFVPTVVAAITSFIIFSLLIGSEPLLGFEASFAFTLESIPLLLAFGAVAGGVAILFSVFLMLTRRLFRLKLPDWADPIAGSVLACVIIFVVGFYISPSHSIAGMGYDEINLIAVTSVPLTMLLVLLFGKLFSSSFVVAGNVSGGVLASSLFVGAMLGAIFGELFYPDSVAAFMFLGMGAVLAATTNTPVATTILMLEISLSFDLIIPLAICISVSYMVSAGTSLYEGQKVTRADEEPDFFPVLDASPNVALEHEESDANPVDPSDNEERAG
ncbi:MAG: chloride channel protein, partial [Candidatus Thorarchaeota archaeon]